MKNQINVRTLLDVFETLRRHGVATEAGFELDDVVGTDTGDGYSLRLSDADVSVDLNFHNTYHFEVADEPTNINLTEQDVLAHKEAKINRFITKMLGILEKYPHVSP
uniref:DUF3081 family protein n=1 Tax=Thaumasiovibrio occultus TaxID=1891184 RepID=UPI000B360386|nr:DUF3081 family protein [Thaumasiovibrio occultus]